MVGDEIKDTLVEVTEEYLKDRLYIIRGKRVMLDADLAEIYGYTTKRLNEQVKRNISKFPEDFMFQTSDEEKDDLRSQIPIRSLAVIRMYLQNKDYICYDN